MAVAPAATSALSLLILDCRIRIGCADPKLLELLVANFGGMASADADRVPALDYFIESRPGAHALTRAGQTTTEAADFCDLLYVLEKDITIELQKRRSELVFLHAAGVEARGKVCLFAAESGSGKSTTTWALLHHGFGYLTDELSAVDLSCMQCLPYPHAICLKEPPPDPYPLPDGAIHLGRTIHIPPQSLPSAVIAKPNPLAAVFLLKYRPDLGAPELRAIGTGEASAYLYASMLNALSHQNHGLDAVVQITSRVPCFSISSAGLPATCALIRSAVERVIGAQA